MIKHIYLLCDIITELSDILTDKNRIPKLYLRILTVVGVIFGSSFLSLAYFLDNVPKYFYKFTKGRPMAKIQTTQPIKVNGKIMNLYVDNKSGNQYKHYISTNKWGFNRKQVEWED